MKARTVVFYGIVLFMAGILVSFMVNQIDSNDTWEDDRWGGDTGEEEYSQSEGEDGTRDDSGLCGMAILPVAILIPSYIYRKKNNE